ncbi:hypothetical protein FFLO_06858 [Filobasidium floriforme]|uniref:Major facilitator superfamily (MFS) profile domain-containing protein n=1 Tax=Filobasidium floriforme TaxID=5210 RepID=A0A8K0NQ28_9TREE|nr:hypothetical protein FFLO_06858 [Filobasidium floriforme]
MREDIEVDKEKILYADGGEEDPNSPANILKRYPLLVGMTPGEREILNKRVRRRIDIWMLPMITFMLFINYLDRTNVTNARVAGMQDDLKMTDVQWSAGISLFYVGYMISQLPGSLILSRGKPRIIMPLMMFCWSVPTICMPLATNATGFMICRLLVGLFEGVFPGIALMTSSIVKDELPFRMAIWHAAITLSSVFGGPLAAAILETMQGVRGLHAWQWFLLIEGAVSIATAGAAYWCLPNWANNTPWMTAEETEMAQYRLVLSAGGHDEGKNELSIFGGAKLAAKDPFTWIFCAMHFFLVIGQAYKDFLPTILQTFGKSKLTTYLLQSPCFFLGFLATLGFGWSAGHFKENTLHIIVPLIFSMGGVLMIIMTEVVGVRYTGVCLLIMGTASGLNLQVSWETSIIPSPRHKKAAVIAIANMCQSQRKARLTVPSRRSSSISAVSSTSHWFTPYFFLTSQEPLYKLGGGLLLVGCGLSIVTAGLIRWRVVRLNRILDKTQDAQNEVFVRQGIEIKEKGWRFPH